MPLHEHATEPTSPGRHDLAALLAANLEWLTTHHYSAETVRNGDGTLQDDSFFSYSGGWPRPSRSVATGDLTGDGNADLIVASVNVGVYVGRGDGDFNDPISQYANGTAHSAVATADFNGDGKLDVVTADSDTGTISVLLGNGGGTLTYVGEFAIGASPTAVAISDFDGDGRPDVVAANGSSNTVSVLLNDQSWEDPLPSLLSVSDATVTEGNTGATNAIFTVTLSKATDADVTVHYLTADGSAVAGSDYTAKSGTVTIPAGQTSRTFAVVVNGDRLAEPAEYFVVNLSSPTNATIADGQGIGTILDDEPRIGINDVSAVEGNSKQTNPFTFTISLSAAYDQAVTVNYATANGTATAGSDYRSKAGTVTFAPGETTKTITVAVIGDKQKEANETFFVNLSKPSFGQIADSQGLGTILNDDGGRAKNKVGLFALAVDAAIEDWMSPWHKKPAHRR